MKKAITIFIFFTILFFIAKPAAAQEKINLYFFYGDGCPHCVKEEKLLEMLANENKNIRVNRYEVWGSYENAKLLSVLGKELNIDISGVPVLILGDRFFVGYLSYETTGSQIKAALENYLTHGCEDRAGKIIADINVSGQKAEIKNEQCVNQKDAPTKLNLPLIGEVNLKSLSLPVLTLILGIADGFNPCAMWILLFLISLLLGMENRKRMWILGSAFIAVSGVVYFIFLAAWLNLFLFLGFILAVRIIISAIAFFSGCYHLYGYFKNRDGKCKVIDAEKRKKTFDKLREIVNRDKFFFALAGIIILACGVNLVELVCSAGLPAVYTQTLSLANLAKWQYYLYLVLYILLYMLDDILIFVVAMTTLKITAANSKYTRWSGLVGGMIMIIIGLLLLFKPGWLMLG